MRRRRLAGLVEILERRGEDLGLEAVGFRRLRAGRGFAHELGPIHDAPAPHLEDLDDGPGRADANPEGVAVAQGRRLHFLLTIAQRADRTNGVADVRRALVFLGGGGLPHVVLEVRDELLLPAL
jgi:hypothetical protein